MAQVDYFLKIDGIEGESTDDKHKNEIEIESWSWGESQAAAAAHGGGGGAGKVSMQDFHFTSRLNKASPRLMLACATGEHIKQAVLIGRKAGDKPQEYLKFTLTDVLVSSYQAKAGPSPHMQPGQPTDGRSLAIDWGDGIPADSFSLNFSKIEFQVAVQRPDGTLGDATKAGWDLKQNRKA
jgi:type VI secretion system secreted protein Hcp